MKSVPYRQENQSDTLTQRLIPHKFEPFVNVDRDPMIGIDVETLDNIAKACRSLQSSNLDIGTPPPINRAIFSLLNEAESREDTDAFSHEPGKNVLGKDDLDPEGKKQKPGDKGMLCEVLGGRPAHGQVNIPHHVQKAVEDAQEKALESVLYGRAGELGRVVRPHELAVFLHRDLRTHEVAADEETVRQHLQQSRR